MTLGVIIVEDDSFTRMLMCGQLAQLGYNVLADTAIAAKALDLTRTLNPDLAVLDLDLGRGPTGIDVAYGLRTVSPKIGIVLLTSYTDVRLIGKQRALPTGSVMLGKQALSDSSVLAAALSSAVDSAIDPAVDSALNSDPSVKQSLIAGLDLSDNQIEILRLVAAGYSNAEIAKKRFMSESGTIKVVNRLVHKLGIEPREGENSRILLAQEYFRLIGTLGSRRAPL